MSTDKKKEPEATKTASSQDKPDESPRQVAAAEPDTMPNQGDESKEQAGSVVTATETEKSAVSENQAEGTKEATPAEKQDEAQKQLAAVQPAAEPEKVNGVQKKAKAKKPEETLTDYLSKLNAIDVEATVVKDEGDKGQETGAKTEPEANADVAISYMDEVAKDVTPVTVTRACQKLDQGKLLGNEALFRDFQKAEEILNDESKNFEEKIHESKDILARFCAFYNFSDHKIKAVFADYAIMIGKFLLSMKDFLHRARKKDKNIPLWGVWADDNLSFIGERTRQNYMKAAARAEAINYSFFGLERLLHLVDATEHLTGADPIGSFLRNHKIGFDPGDDELKMHEFKVEVDVALAVNKAKENEVYLDPAKVKKLIQVGAEIDRKFIADCKLVADAGGDPNKYLDARIENRGKEIDYWEEDKLVARVIAMSDRLVKGFGKLADDPNAAKKLEVSKIEPLELVIARLKQVLDSLAQPSSTANPDSDEKE